MSKELSNVKYNIKSDESTFGGRKRMKYIRKKI